MKLLQHIWLLINVVLISSCAVTQSEREVPSEIFNKAKPISIRESFLSKNEKERKTPEEKTSYVNEKTADQTVEYSQLQPIEIQNETHTRTKQVTAGLSTEASLTVTAEAMSTISFIHYVFGKLLSLNYIVDNTIENNKSTVTLNIQQPLSQKRLMELVVELLEDRNINIYQNEGTYFISSGEKAARAVIGIGRRAEDVPNTTREVLQIVPVTFGTRITTERTINQLLDIQIIPDNEQNAFFLKGPRESVLRGLELINLLDTPANRGRYIGLIELNYIDVKSLKEQLVILLGTEGIEVSENAGKSSLKNVALVTLPRLGATAVFATSNDLINRVRYWTNVLDKPAKGESMRYFIFTPKNARATDIFLSLSGLLGNPNSGSIALNSPAQNNQLESSFGNQNSPTTQNAPPPGRTSAVFTDNLRAVVDERSNSIIIQSTGAQYQTLEPLLNRLDTLPKQVMLDILIAEVSLKDEFRLGVEWALKRNGINYTTQGAFGATSFAGLALGINEEAGLLNATALAGNNLVNVVSNPTLLVRDGITATINVGTDIAVTGNTTIDPIIGQRQTVETEYRQTGIDITITPTINTSDFVIMNITQSISNTIPGSTGASGNPDIFERSLSTEVVAQSGQTILLGGLISEDRTRNNQGIPILRRIPLLGNLAKGQSEASQKTELIMLITAKVMATPDLWKEIKEDFSAGLESLTTE